MLTAKEQLGPSSIVLCVKEQSLFLTVLCAKEQAEQPLLVRNVNWDKLYSANAMRERITDIISNSTMSKGKAE